MTLFPFTRLLGRVTNSYTLIVIISLVFGALAPRQGIFLTPYVELFLQIIFFLSALKINPDVFRDIKKETGLLLRANVYMLIVLPLLVYGLKWILPWDITLAFIILAAMPVGMTAPLLTELGGGHTGLALFLTITTSLLSPITIPIIMKLTANADVAVDFTSMFFNLLKIIVIPFFLAQMMVHFLPKQSKQIGKISKPVSVICLALLLIGVVAAQPLSFSSDIIMTNFGWIAASVLLFVIMHIVGFFCAYHSTRKEHITMSICLTYMNITLAIYIAQKFIDNPKVTSILILAMFPWALLFPVFNKIRQKYLSKIPIS